MLLMPACRRSGTGPFWESLLKPSFGRPIEGCLGKNPLMIGQQATSQRCRHFSVLRGRAGETNIGEVVVRYHAHAADPVLGIAGERPRLKRLTICPVLYGVTDSVPEKLVIRDAVGQATCPRHGISNDQ